VVIQTGTGEYAVHQPRDGQRGRAAGGAFSHADGRRTRCSAAAPRQLWRGSIQAFLSER